MKNAWHCPKCNNGEEEERVREIVLKDRKYLNAITTLTDDHAIKLSHFCTNCDMIYITETTLSSTVCFWEHREPKAKPNDM